MTFLSLGGDRTGTATACHKFGEKIFVLSLSLLPRSPRDHRLYFVEQVFRDDRLVRPQKEFAFARNHSMVDGILQKSLQAGQGEHISLVAAQSGILEFQSQCPYGMLARGKAHECLVDEWRAFRINRNSFCFHIVHISNGRKRGPLAPVQLLSNTALHILTQIIHVVLALSEGDIEHELSLWSALEPEAAKLEILECSRIQQINNLSSVHAIARKTVGMP